MAICHTIRTYIEAFKEFVVHALEAGDVVFVFDRYFEGSTKAYLRTLRQMKEATCRVHVLSEDMPVPRKMLYHVFIHQQNDNTASL